MSDIVMGQRLHDVMKLWHEGIKEGMLGTLKMGKAINLLKKNKLWVRDCAGIPSFRYYVEHELGISVAQAHRLDEIFREVGHVYEALVNNGIYVNISAITLLLPHLHDKTDAEKVELLTANSGIPLVAVKDNVRELAGGKPTDECDHQKTEMFERCVACGKFFKSDF